MARRRARPRRWRLAGAGALAAALPVGGLVPTWAPRGVSLALAPRALAAPKVRPNRLARRAAPGEGPSPEAWRDFRAQLVSGGLKLTTDSEGPAIDAPTFSRPTVAPGNERLLREQSQALWNEYINGAWAHQSPLEAGGLLCRQPLAAQLVHNMRRGQGLGSRWGDKLRERFLAELPEPEEGRSREELFTAWSRNTNYCYRLAESLIGEALEGMMEKASDGQLDARRLTDAERELLVMYGREQETWQSVCLVLRTAPGSIAAEAVAINRPIARGVDEDLARLLLGGRRSPPSDERLSARCASAFGQEAAVYLGGPERHEEAALCIHGFGELAGAEEVAPGTRIYTGGAAAAIEGVLDGAFSPLDFRWFVGCYTGLSSETGDWTSMACARPIALKQCLGLPKPLWHEVMELAGGDSAAISRMELLKRTDLANAEASPASGDEPL